MKPCVSIIIRAYNEEEHIGRLLTGISHQTIAERQVILVDSGSQDATVQIASQYPVEVISIPPADFTFGHSLNEGIRQAKADLLVFASAHVYPVYPDWLELLLKPFENERVALTYGKQRGSENTAFSEHQIFKAWFPDQADPHQSTPFCNNANAAIRRALWEQNPYDETLPGLEDLAWGQWAYDHNYLLRYVPEAEVIHVHNQSTDGIFNRYRREGMAFKKIYPHESFGRRDMYRLFFRNVINDWREAARLKVWGRNWKKIVQFRWNQFSGTYQGYRQSGPLTWQLKQAFYYPNQEGVSIQPSEPRDVKPIQYREKES
jgi:glycosyltransferase involved in cell wall biosynthesis